MHNRRDAAGASLVDKRRRRIDQWSPARHPTPPSWTRTVGFQVTRDRELIAALSTLRLVEEHRNVNRLVCDAHELFAAQNMLLSFLDVSGTTCRTSQCSTILSRSSKRKMSMPA
jgi:hypothetical protein